jgi:hypothetical protein
MDTKYIKLFLTGSLQVLLVALNTYFIAHVMIIQAVVVAFLISLVWTFNVKKISIGNNLDRIIYSAGASFGTLISFLIIYLIYGK